MRQEGRSLCRRRPARARGRSVRYWPTWTRSRWEEDREAFEESLRAATLTVPAEATTLAVSLDGVMAPMKDGQRQAKRAAAQARAERPKGRPATGR